MARRKHWTTVTEVDSGHLVVCDCGQLEEVLACGYGAAVNYAKQHQAAAEYAERQAVAR
jgi:hypothetical protein